jgi:hypothetical protein
MEFGTATLPLGEMELDIVSGKPSGKPKPGLIERILLRTLLSKSHHVYTAFFTE